MPARHWTGDDESYPEPNGLSYHEQLWQAYQFAVTHGFASDWLLAHHREDLPGRLQIERDRVQQQTVRIAIPVTEAEQVYERR